MSVQIDDRKAKLEKMRAWRADPYGSRFTDVTKNPHIRAGADKMGVDAGQILEGGDAKFRPAGRVRLKREMGKVIFMTIRAVLHEHGFIEVGTLVLQPICGRRATAPEACQ